MVTCAAKKVDMDGMCLDWRDVSKHFFDSIQDFVEECTIGVLRDR